MASKNPRRKRATLNPDHVRQRQVPTASDEEIERRLEELVKPAMYAELEYYRQTGMRNRLLTLPVMVSLVLAMIWRHVPGVCTLQRMLAKERILWTEPTKVSQPALSERFLTFPAVLFERVLYRVIARLPERHQQRSRPEPALVQALHGRFAAFWAVDGTTLTALFRKLKNLQAAPDAPLAGHLVAVVDLISHLPAKLWFFEDPSTNDKTAIPDLLAWLVPNCLIVFDMGYFSFPFFDALTQGTYWFVTRLRNKTSYQVQRVLIDRPHFKESIVQLGKYRSNPSQYPVRLIEVYLGTHWYRYITNVLEPKQLSAMEVIAVYGCRWHIETTFLFIKRLLNLAYLWVGSLNGVQLQIWATFLFYAILIDLCDQIADELHLPLDRISVEMVYRSLYFYHNAVQQGYPQDAAKYLAEEADSLGIIKRQRPRAGPSLEEQVRRALLTSPLRPAA